MKRFFPENWADPAHPLVTLITLEHTPWWKEKGQDVLQWCLLTIGTYSRVTCYTRSMYTFVFCLLSVVGISLEHQLCMFTRFNPERLIIVVILEATRR